MQELWTEVDRYYGDLLAPADEQLEAARVTSEEAGLPAIAVSRLQGKFLEVLVRITGARRVLEIGTLGGYSTIWMARALPADGRIVTLEFDPHHAEVAQTNLRRAGVRIGWICALAGRSRACQSWSAPPMRPSI